jgi:5-deoxy-glucuronate isomerase
MSAPDVSDGGIHATALPNDLPPDRLRLRPDASGAVSVDPAIAGWRYLSFATAVLSGTGSLPIGGSGHETALVLLAGGDAVIAQPDGPRHVLKGRATVFAGPPSAFYLPAGRSATVTSGSGGATTVAIATAPTRPEVSAGLKSVLIAPADIRIEVRGAGRSTRQIRHVITPEFPADRLLLVEVLTPAGNWSSWPPHKHDVDDMPDEAVLEEVYHYRFRRPEAWAIQRVYRPAGSPLGPPRDGLWAVRDGEVVLVTDGYHPFAATDADDAWYLNALAGDRRTMACSFDPALDHVRARWASEAPDPRIALIGRAG